MCQVIVETFVEIIEVVDVLSDWLFKNISIIYKHIKYCQIG